MVKTQKTSNFAREYLDGLDDQQTDQRHSRRVIDINDFRRLLEAAMKGEKEVRHDWL